ncbi:hypothetical protein [Desulfosporosinus sp. SB140]|uniref:hypothetical protein n=1 Tax=Desulfosporosinus paludis TaxID=3115649 RepID=UPI00388F489A
MINKLLSIFLGAVLWGVGAYLDVVVAIGKYGLLGLLAGVLLALGLLITKAFLEKKTNLDLWILIFRGLAVETLLFPIANLIMVYMLNNGLPFEETRAVLIESCLIAAILAGAFSFNAHLLNTKIRQLRTRRPSKE